MLVYKITSRAGCTYKQTRWRAGVEHTELGGSAHIPGCGWLHAYATKELAFALYPGHTTIGKPKLWLADADVVHDHGDMLLCTRIKILEQVDIPNIHLLPRVLFAIKAAKQVVEDSRWLAWADKWSSERNTGSYKKANKALMKYTHEELVTYNNSNESAYQAVLATDYFIYGRKYHYATSASAAMAAIHAAAYLRLSTNASKVLDLAGLLQEVLDQQCYRRNK